MSGQKDAPNYKKTLNLPKTDFPMRGGLANKEPGYIERWNKEGIYAQIQKERQGAEQFILHDGPPYANGNIHHGHILNKVLKDFVVKHHTMLGQHSPYVPGWDCHGLPIEHQVDKKLGKKKRDMTQVEIRQACRRYAEEYVGIQRDDFKRLGIFGDWDDPYTTMSYDYEARTVRLLGEFFRAGNVYKGLKPVHWSWAAQTALADAEVEYDAFVAPSIYVKFAFNSAPDFLTQAAGGRDISVVIWTTTPWTLPANLAIVLNPDFEYLLLGINGEGKHAGSAVIMAEGLMENTLKDCKIDAGDVEELARFKGAELVGTGVDDATRLTARHPFLDRDSVLLPADYVTLEQGTGCVHTAPGHGEEDFHLGRQFGLDVLNPVDNRGKYTSKFAQMEGIQVFAANPKIVEILDDKGVLLSHPKLTVKIERYPHCWRTKKPIIFRATEQWFIGLDKPIKDADGKDTGETLRQRALNEIDKVEWIPSWGRERILGMMENRPDWCISRQRLWGVPITVFYCDKCDTDIVDHEVAFHVADCAEEHGSDIWFDWDAPRLVPEGYCCPNCGAGSETFRKETDILDVWFDSGSSWSAVLDRKMGAGQVADLYLEGSDQHRGWFNSSLLIGLGTANQSPYKACLTHGFVVDENGRKYSKSSPNYEKPSKMINVDGAEILRLWVAAVDYRADIKLTGEIIKTVKDAYRKLRNTFRFLLGTVSDFDPNKDARSYDEMDELDRWALAKTNTLVARVHEAYNNCAFHTIYHDVVRFATVELSNTYLNILKDRLYSNAPDDAARRASQTALYEILSALVRLMAPILTFTAEEVWDHMPHRSDDPSSVHLSLMPQVNEAWNDDALVSGFESLLAIRSEVQRHLDALRPKKRGERKPGQIGSSEEAVVTLRAQGAELETLKAFEAKLPEYFIVSTVAVQEAAPGESSLDGQRGAEVGVHVESSKDAKCPRCWRYGYGVGSVAAFPDLCYRCGDVMSNLS